MNKEDKSRLDYFEEDEKIISHALKSIRMEEMKSLITECEQTLKAGHKIVVSGLGKMCLFVISLWELCSVWAWMQVFFIRIQQYMAIWGWYIRVIW